MRCLSFGGCDLPLSRPTIGSLESPLAVGDTLSIKEILIKLLDMDHLFDPATYVESDHQPGE